MVFFDSLNLKTMVVDNKEKFTTPTRRSNPSNDNERIEEVVQRQRRRKTRKVLMKRRRSIFRRRDENGIEKKVQTLQRLVPTRVGSDNNQGLDGLFTDTASYIISLQMRVRVMQIMVDVMENSQNLE
ncbi:transcription factor UPBEAT1 [Spinacia oleracea]|uniref:Transcription factor UPBEAT1 n=1 Tax=Spinacia oleracea TaxID=3562 RepID=A0A9R0HSD9_SPIOL|nr:transcription factor UPBEAT1-like [Spinacia oleracea]